MIGVFCGYCGKSLPEGLEFCGFCGKTLPAQPESKPKPVAQPASPPVELVNPATAPTIAPRAPPPPVGSTGAPILLTKVKGRLPTGVESPADLRDNGTAAPREFDRHPVAVEVSFESDNNFYTGLAQNISGGGVFVATHRLLPIGDELDISLELPGGTSLKVAGRVCWVRDDRAATSDAPAGMGVKFNSLAAGAKVTIEAFLQQREPIFYDM